MKEYQHTAEDYRERRRSWSRSRLEAAGISLFGASAEPESDLWGDKIVKITKANSALQEKFSRGDVLSMLTPEDELPRDCLVIDVGEDWMSVGVGPNWPPGVWEARRESLLVRLDRMAPQVPLRAQRSVLELLRRRKGGHIAELIAKLDVQREEASHRPDRFSPLLDLPKRINESLESAKSKAPSFVPNKSQEDSIRWALQRKISLIQGPAGTGKSRLAALLVSTALELAPNEQILAVAHSNGAADVLLQALIQIGVPAVRVGRPATVSTDLQHRTVVALTEHHPEVIKARSLCKDIAIPDAKRLTTFDVQRVVQDVQESITRTAPVLVTSCIGAQQLQNVNCPLVVLDEAAQSTEPAFLCSLVSAQAEQVVLVGDTCQLPPTVSCMELKETLGESPMARFEQLGVEKHTLRIQYRMAPALLEYPSKYFYQGKVVCADSNQLSVAPDGFPWPTELPVAFVDVFSDKEIAHDGGGKSNPTEAKIIAGIIGNLIRAGHVTSNRLAVISPYSKQVQQIRTELAARRCPDDIRVGTVDSFQGQETDVVIISCVRSNKMNEIGFLRDSRRLCVAITRARVALIIVGDRGVLKCCKHWNSLLEYMEERGCTLPFGSLPREPRPELLPIAHEGFDPLQNLFGQDSQGVFEELIDLADV